MEIEAEDEGKQSKKGRLIFVTGKMGSEVALISLVETTVLEILGERARIDGRVRSFSFGGFLSYGVERRLG